MIRVKRSISLSSLVGVVCLHCWVTELDILYRGSTCRTTFEPFEVRWFGQYRSRHFRCWWWTEFTAFVKRCLLRMPNHCTAWICNNRLISLGLYFNLGTTTKCTGDYYQMYLLTSLGLNGTRHPVISVTGELGGQIFFLNNLWIARRQKYPTQILGSCVWFLSGMNIIEKSCPTRILKQLLKAVNNLKSSEMINLLSQSST
jgi:hypothetical protein